MSEQFTAQVALHPRSQRVPVIIDDITPGCVNTRKQEHQGAHSIDLRHCIRGAALEYIFRNVAHAQREQQCHRCHDNCTRHHAQK
jgi:hypothetical protein